MDQMLYVIWNFIDGCKWSHVDVDGISWLEMLLRCEQRMNFSIPHQWPCSRVRLIMNHAEEKPQNIKEACRTFKKMFSAVVRQGIGKELQESMKPGFTSYGRWFRLGLKNTFPSVKLDIQMTREERHNIEHALLLQRGCILKDI